MRIPMKSVNSWFLFICICVAFNLVVAKNADAESWGNYQAGDRRSGYTYATTETRAMQDDDFVNPAFGTLDDKKARFY